MAEPEKASERPWPLGAAVVALATALVLRGMGRTWWCRCGSPSPWSSGVADQHTSQHLFDPYSFTHLLHGFLFCALLTLALRRWVGPRGRLGLAIVMESCWELLENSSWVVERYRKSTVSLDYYGDSVLNSLGDVACCTVGFLIARRLPLRVSLAVVVAIELGLLATVRDNLTLNVVMLLYPMEAVKTWQAGH